MSTKKKAAYLSPQEAYAKKMASAAKRRKMWSVAKISMATVVAATFAFLFLTPIVLTITNSFMSASEISANYGTVFATDANGGKVYIAEKVNLKAIAGVADLGVVEADCFVIAEPAVSAQKGKGFHIVGDLQKLYGADEKGNFGYPQAVLVAKNSLISEREAWLNSFLESVEESVSWAVTASAETLVSAINGHLEDESYQSTLKAPLLTSEAIIGCGLRYVSAGDCKERIKEYLLGLQAVDAQSAVVPSEAFFR